MQENDDLIYLTPQGALALAWALIEEAHLVGLPSPSLYLMVESEHCPPVIRRADEPGQVRPRSANPDEPGSPPGPLLQAIQQAAE